MGIGVQPCCCRRPGQVYWYNGGSSHGIYRCTVNGKNIKLISRSSENGGADFGVVIAIDFDEQFAYFSDLNNAGIYRCPINGGPSELLATAVRDAYTLAVTTDYIFYSAPGFPLTDSRVYRINKSDGTGSVPLDDFDEFKPTGTGWTFSQAGTLVFYASGLDRVFFWTFYHKAIDAQHVIQVRSNNQEGTDSVLVYNSGVLSLAQFVAHPMPGSPGAYFDSNINKVWGARGNAINLTVGPDFDIENDLDEIIFTGANFGSSFISGGWDIYRRGQQVFGRDVADGEILRMNYDGTGISVIVDEGNGVVSPIAPLAVAVRE